MFVQVLAFGALRERLPQGGLRRELRQGETVGSLLASLEGDDLFSAGVLRSVAVAVNQDYARKDHQLADGDEVALLPPVSGGLETPVCLVRDEIYAAKLTEEIKQGADGAVVVFDGIVRDNTRGRATLHLDYEAYEEMALKQMHRLRTDAITRFGVRDVIITHRLGRLVVGETSVFIAVASAHRGAAFDACRWVIDRLKQTVPIWKREQFVDGAVWADGEPFPSEIVGAGQ